jgi:glycosyltransferase involved in cell wall biosynthesis
MISVLILTRNEEQDLPGCLQSVAWSDDVHVFDSLSTDRTVAIAEGCGAIVTQRAFDGYASQRNAALHGLPFRHPWVLIVDADERIPAACADTMQEFVRQAPAGAVAARLRRRDFLMGTWLRHAQISPFYIRLVRPDKVRYEREINEVLKADGEIVDLAEPFDHHPFSKGIRHWIDKHNAYSTMEAGIALAARCGKGQVSWHRALFAADFNERRFHQKEIFYLLPFRPFIKWLYMMVVRQAFLDGRAGMTYAALQAIYEYFIVLKSRELEAAAPAATLTAKALPGETEPHPKPAPAIRS